MQSGRVHESAWERLLELLDRLVDDDTLPVDDEAERAVATLLSAAAADGEVDAELRLPDITRWTIGLVRAHHAVRAAHPEIPSDDELAQLRRILTRWLHPARPRS